MLSQFLSTHVYLLFLVVSFILFIEKAKVQLILVYGLMGLKTAMKDSLDLLGIQYSVCRPGGTSGEAIQRATFSFPFRLPVFNPTSVVSRA